MDDEDINHERDMDRNGGSPHYPSWYEYDLGPHGEVPIGPEAYHDARVGHGVYDNRAEFDLYDRGLPGHVHDEDVVEEPYHGAFEHGHPHGYEHGYPYPEGVEHGYPGHDLGHEYYGGQAHGLHDAHEMNLPFQGPHPQGDVNGFNMLHQQEYEEAGDGGRHPHAWKHGHHHAHNPNGRQHHNGHGDLETHLHDDF